jgi:hypothetical protein
VSTVPDPSQLREAIIASPALCPLEWSTDSTAVLFGRFAEEAFGEVSFFDRRAVPKAERTGVVPWAMAEPWLAGLPRQCDFLFHISHCGSTLLSRLLGTAETCLAVREPGILRGLSATDPEPKLDATLALLSRTFHQHQRPLIKATSVVNAVADRLLHRTPGGRAALVFIPPSTFLPGVLDGSFSDIESHAESRWARLTASGLSLPVPVSPGEHAAAAWLCEMRALLHLAQQFPERTRWVNFEQFLATPEPVLTDLARFFGLSLDVPAVLAGPLMQRYAKQLSVRYDTASREALLTQARTDHSSEIDAGLAWLTAAGWPETLQQSTAGV